MKTKSPARQIISKVCREHKNSDLRADSDCVIEAIDEAIAQLQIQPPRPHSADFVEDAIKHTRWLKAVLSMLSTQEHRMVMDELRAMVAEALRMTVAGVGHSFTESDADLQARKARALEYLQEQIVDTIYLDDGRIIDVRGNSVLLAIEAKQ